MEKENWIISIVSRIFTQKVNKVIDSVDVKRKYGIDYEVASVLFNAV